MVNPVAWKTGGSVATVLATDYNAMHERVKSILVNGADVDALLPSEYGYGQAITSSTATAGTSGDLIAVDKLEELRTDIQKVWEHQTTAAFELDAVTTSDIITAGASPTTVLEPNQDNKTFNDYTFAINTIDSRIIPDPSLNNTYTNVAGGMTTPTYILRSPVTGSGVTNWNGTLNHIVSVTWASADAKRYYFNTGGRIMFYAELLSPPASSDARYNKTIDWRNIFGTWGGSSYTSHNTHIYGWKCYRDNIGVAPTTVYTVSTFTGAGVYSDNYYRVTCTHPNATQIIFTISMVDGDTGTGSGTKGSVPIDENVAGYIISYVTETRKTATGWSIAQPVFVTTNSL